jgi:hypothetical protein
MNQEEMFRKTLSQGVGDFRTAVPDVETRVYWAIRGSGSSQMPVISGNFGQNLPAQGTEVDIAGNEDYIHLLERVT